MAGLLDLFKNSGGLATDPNAFIDPNQTPITSQNNLLTPSDATNARKLAALQMGASILANNYGHFGAMGPAIGAGLAAGSSAYLGALNNDQSRRMNNLKFGIEKIQAKQAAQNFENQNKAQAALGELAKKSPQGIDPSQAMMAVAPYIDPEKFVAFSSLLNKPLPAPMQTNLSGAVSAATTMRGLQSTFKDEYGGKPLYGGVQNRILSMVGDPTGQAQWWQQYENQKNRILHSLFGSQMTHAEMQRFNSANINQSMSPSMIRRNLAIQAQAAEQAAKKLAAAYGTTNYNKHEIQALTQGLGDPNYTPFAQIMHQVQSTPGQAKVPDTVVNPFGGNSGNGGQQPAAQGKVRLFRRGNTIMRKEADGSLYKLENGKFVPAS